MNSRTKARLRAVESLFEADQRGEDPVEVLQRRRLHTAAQISSYSEQIVRGVRDRREELNEYLNTYARDWSLERMPATDRVVLLIGAWELLFNDDISREALEIMNETNKRYGCTSFLPTLITSPDEKIEKAIELVKGMEDKEEIGVLGLHIEGPYISVEKKGIHRSKYIRVLSDEMIEKIAKAGPEVTRIITIAPEKAKVEHLKKLRDAGINVAIGHTNATYKECVEKKEYYNCGTHLYNAMRGLDSREPGVVGFLFNNDTTNCGIIVDGLHIDFASVEIAKKIMKDRLYLVTDAVSPAGTDNMTEFMFEGNRVLYRDGKCISPEGTLGGSSLVMIKGVQNLVEEVHISLEEALRMATSYPAEAVAIDEKYGLASTRRDYKDYVYSDEDIRNKYQDKLKAVLRMPEAFAELQGDTMYVLVADTLEEMKEMERFVGELK